MTWGRGAQRGRGSRGERGRGDRFRRRMTRGHGEAGNKGSFRGAEERRAALGNYFPSAPLHRTPPHSLTPHPSLSALRYGHLLRREVIRAPCPCRRVGSEATLRVSPSPRHSLVLVFKFLPQSLCAEVEKSFLCGCLFCCFFRAPFSFAKLLPLEPNFRCEAIWIVIILPGFLHVILR